MLQKKILLVEDDLDLREVIHETLSDSGYEVQTASDGEQAIECLRSNRYDIIVSDVQMPVLDGRELLQQVRQLWVDTPMVLMTAYGTIEQAVGAMREGAVDYLVKPFDADTLLAVIGRSLNEATTIIDVAVTQDPASTALYELASRVAKSDVSVMIDGESGTGKEVLARFIHQNSSRSNGPFIAINCAAIPENMLEAVLFGYEKGAFTGAYQRTAGKFELANGGTLLLDEISEMDLGLQAKLLRVLQEREVERLGGHKSIELDVRVLATTNRDLREQVRSGRFREDLFYRLNVFPLTVPPLRERADDIITLAHTFIQKHIRTGASDVPALATSACQKLLRHSWPGNVRELENVIQRALVVYQGKQITADDLIIETETPATEKVLPAKIANSAELDSDLRQHEQELILQALRASHGSRKLAAEALGISPRTLRYKISRMRDNGIIVPKAYGMMSA